MSWVKVAEVMRKSEWVVDVKPTGYRFIAWEWEAYLETSDEPSGPFLDDAVFREVLRIVCRTAGFGHAWTEKGARRAAQRHIESWKDAMPGADA